MPLTKRAPGAPLPVTLLSGFLGAGKTTLLQHILRNKEGLRCAVLVNDMAEVNIDASLVKGTKLLQQQERMVELHNGCICCTLRDDLLQTLREFAETDEFDVVVIESTGVAEPMEVAETFFLEPPDGGPRLAETCRLDNCVTVVDASTFADNLRSVESVTEKYGDAEEAPPCAPGQAEEEAPEDDRNIAHLLIDQVEFANLVVLNKTDLVDEARLKETLALIASLNSKAKVMCTSRSQVDLDFLLFTNKFSESYAVQAKGWMADILNAKEHVPETVQYGIGSFVFRAEAAFHPKRIYDFATKYFLLQETVEPVLPDEDEDEGAPADDDEAAPVPTDAEEKAAVMATLQARQVARHSELGGVMRSKGYVWIGAPSRIGGFGEWNHAGNVLAFGYGGGWGMFPDPDAGVAQKAGALARAHVEKAPQQEIVFIGQGLKRDVIEAELRACLLTPEEDCRLRQAIYAAGDNVDELTFFEDPFEPWPREEEDEARRDDEAAAAEAAAAKANAPKWAATATAQADDDDEDESDEDGGLK